MTQTSTGREVATYARGFEHIRPVQWRAEATGCEGGAPAVCYPRSHRIDLPRSPRRSRKRRQPTWRYLLVDRTAGGRPGDKHGGRLLWSPVDGGRQLAIEAWVTSREGASIENSCKSHAKGDDSIPEEYQGHLAFKAKHLEGLPEYGPFDHGINLKEGRVPGRRRNRHD
jgi:hypothetical protein